MPKTDKELTVEIVCTFIASCNPGPNQAPLPREKLQDVIKITYSTIAGLGLQANEPEE